MIGHTLFDGSLRRLPMSWIVAVSHPQREFRALRSLADNGFWAWLPTRTIRRKPRHMKGREVSRDYPLFGGGYIFVRDAELSSLGSRSAARRDFYGVDDIRAVICSTVADVRRPLKISDGSMDDLRYRIENPPMPIVEDVLRIGDSVFVTDGPFWTFRGEVAAHDQDHGILSVLLNLFGRSTPVQMSVDQLRRAA